MIFDWFGNIDPYIIPKGLETTTKKGHPRNNWEQKKTAYNHRVAKRRAKNKASRKARKKNKR